MHPARATRGVKMSELLSESEARDAVAALNDWTLTGTESITRTFKFGDHIEAMGFVTRVAMAAEVANHHPDLRIVYSTVEITLSTHDAGGLTAKDTSLAKQIDQFV
jgi:4a-hydroxytetrahydrobiopterin dehydratase